MGNLNDSLLKKATEMQAKLVAKFPLQVKQAMQKDVKEWEKKHGRKPTIAEMVQPFKENSKFMDALGLAIGMDMETIEKIAKEVLDDGKSM